MKISKKPNMVDNEASISPKSIPSKKWKKSTVFGAGILLLVLIPIIVFSILNFIGISNLNARLSSEEKENVAKKLILRK